MSNARNQLLFLPRSLNPWYAARFVSGFVFKWVRTLEKHSGVFKWVKTLEKHSELCSAQRKFCSCICALRISRATEAVALACNLMQGALHMGKLVAQQIKPLPPQLELNMEK